MAEGSSGNTTADWHFLVCMRPSQSKLQLQNNYSTLSSKYQQPAIFQLACVSVLSGFLRLKWSSSCLQSALAQSL